MKYRISVAPSTNCYIGSRTMTDFDVNVDVKQTTIAVSLPIFEKGSLAAWLKWFDGYCLLLDLDNTAKLRLLPCVSIAAVLILCGKLSVVAQWLNPLFQRLLDHIKHEDRLADPLWHFFLHLECGRDSL